MRILYLHQYFKTPNMAGGTRSYEFARRWIAMGHEVCMIISSAGLSADYQHLTEVTVAELAGIPCIVIPVPYSNQMAFSQRIRAFVRFALLASREAMKQPADVVFATSTPLTIAIPAIAAKLRRRIPMVFEVRDLWPAKPIAMGALRNPLLRWAARLLEWVAYRASAHVVVLSPDAAAAVASRGVDPVRVSLIPNSCDISLFDVPAHQGDWVRARLGLSSAQALVVYTGTFGFVNGLNYVVEMAEHLRDVNIHFLLVGEGVERDQIYQRAAYSGLLDHNLSIWDSLPKAEMPDVLAAATLATSFVVPVQELWDNSANKFFDALAAGKPVAINHGGWQADLLTQSGAGLVLPANDPMAAAQQLAAFVADSRRVHAAGEAARNLARTQFDRDSMAAQLEAILQAVVNK